MVPDASGKKPSGVRGERHRLRGPSRIDAVAPAAPPAAKKRVLFVCIGNSCRSQMAEAFAQAYGADILEVQSAGVAPASYIAPLTKQTLGEWNLNIDDHFPKGMDVVQRQAFDVVVNMSGSPLRLPGKRVVDWIVRDPIGQSEEFYRTFAKQIEGLVMRLILELRTAP
jgi:arsenate reductase (thioredoxin)